MQIKKYQFAGQEVEAVKLSVDSLDEVIEWSNGSLWLTLFRLRVKGMYIGDLTNDAEENYFARFGDYVIKRGPADFITMPARQFELRYREL